MTFDISLPYHQFYHWLTLQYLIQRKCADWFFLNKSECIPITSRPFDGIWFAAITCLQSRGSRDIECAGISSINHRQLLFMWLSQEVNGLHKYYHDDVIKWKHFPRYWPFVHQRPVTRSFDVCFDLRLNKRLNKQSWGWWFETLSRPLWRHSNAIRRFTA